MFAAGLAIATCTAVALLSVDRRFDKQRFDTVVGEPMLLQMFALQQDNDDMMASSFQQRLRRNALLFRGLMEFPTIVLSRYVYNDCVLLVGGNVLAKSNVMSAYGSANIWQKHLALSDVMKEIPN